MGSSRARTERRLKMLAPELTWTGPRVDLPGSLAGSFMRSIIANSGKWLRHESSVSNPAFSIMIIIRANAKLM